MKYLVDSDVLIDFFNDDVLVIQRVDQLLDEGVAISTIAYMEVLEGKLKTQTLDDAREDLAIFMQLVTSISVTQREAARCAVIRRYLRANNRRVRPRALDLLIAATAIEHDLVLVTRNHDDYHDIPDLQMINL
ncbi:hypothetical protein BH09CHL1_BH09CHL1_20860 [soil metagenome]